MPWLNFSVTIYKKNSLFLTWSKLRWYCIQLKSSGSSLSSRHKHTCFGRHNLPDNYEVLLNRSPTINGLPKRIFLIRRFCASILDLEVTMKNGDSIRDKRLPTDEAVSGQNVSDTDEMLYNSICHLSLSFALYHVESSKLKMFDGMEVWWNRWVTMAQSKREGSLLLFCTNRLPPWYYPWYSRGLATSGTSLFCFLLF